MKKIVSQIFVFLLFTVLINAQTKEEKAVLIDDFEVLGLEDTFARLDNLLIQLDLTKTQKTKAVVRIYGENEICFLCRYNFGSWVSAIIKNTRKIPDEKYSIEYCDENRKKLRIELYLLPDSANLPKCEETLEIPQKSILFDVVNFFYEGYKMIPIEETEASAVGPPQGEYSLNTWQKIKSLLSKSPESKVYVIAYLGTNPETKFEEKNGKTIEKTAGNLDKKSLAKEMLLTAENELIKIGIKSSQIESMQGGYIDGKKKLQLWFVPKGAEIPKPKPDYFPKKNK